MMDKLTEIKNLLTILIKLITPGSKVSKFVAILRVTTATPELSFISKIKTVSKKNHNRIK